MKVAAGKKKYVGKFEVEQIEFTGKCTKSKIPYVDVGYLLPGESFFVPEDEMAPGNVASSISYARTKYNDGRVFVTRVGEKDGVKGTRVYRIK